MILFQKVRYKNFLSTGQQFIEIDLDKANTTLVVGENGAGKSTLIKILSGAHAPDTGQIYFEGNEVKFKSTKQAMNLGIETIYQYLEMKS